MLWAWSISFAVAAEKPILLFSDLTAAPNSGWSQTEPQKGAVVTLWGRHFGSARGNSYVTVNGTKLQSDSDYVDTWGETSNPVPFLETITFQLNNAIAEGEGEISVTVNGVTSVSIPFRIGQGHIYFVDVNHPHSGTGSLEDPWSDLSDFIDVMQPGDIAYFREGIYDQKYNGGKSNIWVRSSEPSGTAEFPIAFVGYPNEKAVFDSMTHGERVEFNKSIEIDSAYITLSKLSTDAFGSGIQAGPFSRVIGNDAIGTQKFVQGTGILVGGSNGMKFYANAVHGSRTESRFDHSIYLSGCADSIGADVAYNYSYDNSFGRGPHIVVNSQEQRCRSDQSLASHHIRHNLVDCGPYPSRAIGIFDLSWDRGEAQEPEPTLVYNNIIVGCGQGYGAMYHNNGHAYFYNNTLYNTPGLGLDVHGDDVLSTRAINNVFHQVPGSNTGCVDGRFSILDSNAYYGGCDIPTEDHNAVTGDPLVNIDLTLFEFHLSPLSPLVNTGSSAVADVITTDFLSSPRSGIDIGALQHDESGQPGNYPPTAVIHAETTDLNINQDLLLDGSGSQDLNGDPLSFQWMVTQQPDNSQVVLSAENSEQTVFIADTVGRYVLTLEVDDGTHAATASIELTLTGSDSDPDDPSGGDGNADDVVYQQSGVTDFDGSTFEEIAHEDAFLLDEGVIAFWFQTDRLGQRQGLLSKDSGDYDDGGHLTLLLENDGRIRYRLQSTSKTYELFSDTRVTTDSWHHVAVAFGTGGMRLYINGVLEKSDTYAGGLGQTSGGSGNAEPLVLGANAWSSGNRVSTPVKDYLQGRLAGIMFIDGSLSEQELADVISQTHPEEDDPSGGDSDGTNTNVIYQQSGVADFDGSTFEEIAHEDAFLIDEGVIAFWFLANQLGQRQGLVSKDSSDYDDGGHLTLLLESDGRIRYRLQSTSKTYELFSDTRVTTDSWHHVAVAFGAGGMRLYINGALEKSDAYAGGLGQTSGGSGNAEPIVLGGNAWRSGNRISTPVEDFFHGTLTGLHFVEGDVSEQALQKLMSESAVEQPIYQDISATVYSGNDYTQIAHQDDFLLDEGALSFRFKTTQLGQRQGLLSKDARGYGSGGHLTLLLEADGRLRYRLQSDAVSNEIVTDAVIVADQWHDVILTFGQQGMALYIDGALLATNPYSGGLGLTSGGNGNFEPLVLGANAWASEDLSAAPVRDYFHGELGDFSIWDKPIVPE
jgi:hypothetical protein